MSWLRTDDGFTSHPKFEGWTPLQKWSFLELMHYCARYRTKGRVPTDLSLLPRAVTPRLLTLAHRSKWLDHDENGVYWIHDWNIYNPDDPTAAERMKAYRARNANRNEPRNEPRNDDRNETVTRALARALKPVPSLLSSDPAAAVGSEPAAADSATKVELLTLLTAVKWDPDAPAFHEAEPDRALAWLRRALSSPSVENKAGMYRRQMEKPDHWPESNGSAPVSGVPRPLFEVLSTWLSNAGRLDTWSGVEREIQDRSAARGEVLSSEQVEVLRERWQALRPADVPVEPEPP